MLKYSSAFSHRILFSCVSFGLVGQRRRPAPKRQADTATKLHKSRVKRVLYFWPQRYQVGYVWFPVKVKLFLFVFGDMEFVLKKPFATLY